MRTIEVVSRDVAAGRASRENSYFPASRFAVLAGADMLCALPAI
jgi:hypothetical protein